MKFIGVADRRLGLVDDLADRLGVESAEVAEFLDGKTATGRDGPGPSFLDFTSVEKRVRVGVEQFPTERRGFAGVATDQFDFSGVNPLEHRLESLEIESLVEAIVHGLLHEGMVGDLVVAGDILLASGQLGKNGGQQVVGTESLDRMRHFFSAIATQDHQCPGEVPAPSELKHRDRQQCLFEQVAGVVWPQHAEEALERKAVLWSQRENETVVIGGGLEFEIEGSTESLSQGQSPGPVDTRTERGVNHDLHATGLVEESFEKHTFPRGDHPDGSLLGGDVLDNLSGGVFIAESLGGQPHGGLTHPSCSLVLFVTGSADSLGDFLSQSRDLFGEFPGPPRCLASPERNRRRCPTGVRYGHSFSADVVNSPRGVPEQEDVARLALDREILVERPDKRILLGHDTVAADVGDGSGVGACREPG